MMRFPLLLTFSLLCSVSTLKAGFDDILELPQEQREGKLKRKLANLNRKLDSTQFNNFSYQPLYEPWTLKAAALEHFLAHSQELEKIRAVEDYRTAKREIGQIRDRFGIQKKGFTSNEIQIMDSEFQLHNYLLNRYRVGNSAQYGFNMPKAPVVHPYHPGSEEIMRKNQGMPIFSFAAHQHVDELNPLVFPFFSETQTILKQFGILAENVDYFYVVQDDPWKNCQRLLRPQSWVFPNAEFSTPKPYSKGANVHVGIFSPLNSIKLVGSSARVQFLPGGISSHNGVDGKTRLGNRVVISSGGDFPALHGLKDNETNFFVSTVINLATQKAAITFHTILSDLDFAELTQKEIKDIRGLQDWNSSLFKEKYGIREEGNNSIYAGVPWTPLAKDMLGGQREEIPFINPDFAVTPSSASSSIGTIPQGYTFVLDPSQSGRKWGLNGIVPKEEGHITLRGDGYVFYYQLLQSDIIRLAGQKLRFMAEIRSNSPGAYIQYWDYPNFHKTQSARYSRIGEWERLMIEFQVDTRQQQYFLYPAIMPAVSEDSLLPEVEIRGVNLMKVEPLPLTFNSSFVGAHVGIPSGYQFVVDPAQGGRRWGARKVAQMGDGHVAVEGDGYVFYYQIPTAEMRLLHGKQLRFEVDVLSNAPGAYIQYWGYLNSNSEKIKSQVHPGDGSWQRLSLDFTVDENNTRHFIYPVILPAVSESSEAPVVEVKNVRLNIL